MTGVWQELSFRLQTSVFSLSSRGKEQSVESSLVTPTRALYSIPLILVSSNSDYLLKALPSNLC